MIQLFIFFILPSLLTQIKCTTPQTVEQASVAGFVVINANLILLQQNQEVTVKAYSKTYKPLLWDLE